MACYHPCRSCAPACKEFHFLVFVILIVGRCSALLNIFNASCFIQAIYNIILPIDTKHFLQLAVSLNMSIILCKLPYKGA